MAAPIPAQQVPLVDSTGCITSPWFMFFTDLRTRVGGSADLTASVSGSTLTFTYRQGAVTKTGTVTLT